MKSTESEAAVELARGQSPARVPDLIPGLLGCGASRLTAAEQVGNPDPESVEHHLPAGSRRVPPRSLVRSALGEGCTACSQRAEGREQARCRAAGVGDDSHQPEDQDEEGEEDDRSDEAEVVVVDAVSFHRSLSWFAGSRSITACEPRG